MMTFVVYLLILAAMSEAKAELNATFKNAIKDTRNINVRFMQNKSTEPSIHPNQLPDFSKFTDGLAMFPIPYHVSIQMFSDKKYEHLCAGTITDESFVLTAAHCFYKTRNPKRISVVVGSNILSTTKGLRYNVSKIIIHDFYEPLHGWDIALLRMHTRIVFDGKKVGKVNINSTVRVHGDMDTYLIGWGRTNVNVTQILEQVTFRTIDNKKCINRGFIYITKTELCAISHKGRGACDGDSGGPLVSTDFSTQLGILSYGREPCKRGRIYAFTYIHPLVNWILEQMKQCG